MELDFSPEELLEQARGNQTAFWHLAPGLGTAA